jgi:hypothetical protein
LPPDTIVRFVETSVRGGITGRKALCLRDFRAALKHQVAEDKTLAGAWSPADFSGSVRKGEFVTGASNSVWLDLDGIDLRVWESVLAWLAEFEAEAWTTHSWGDPGKPGMRARVRVTVGREHTTRDEVRAARRGLAEVLFAATGAKADPACTDPNRIFFCPAVHPSRVGTERVWVFDGPSRPVVDDLIARGRTAGTIRRDVKARLVEQGMLPENSVATDADRARAELVFGEELARLVHPRHTPGRKNALFALGGMLRAWADAGALDLAAWEARVLAGLLANHADGEDLFATHFCNGRDTATEFAFETEEDARAIDAAAGPLLAEHEETKTRDRVRAMLASAPEPTVDSVEDLDAQLATAIQGGLAHGKTRLRVIQVNAGGGKTSALARESGRRALEASAPFCSSRRTRS